MFVTYVGIKAVTCNHNGYHINLLIACQKNRENRHTHRRIDGGFLDLPGSWPTAKMCEITEIKNLMDSDFTHSSKGWDQTIDTISKPNYSKRPYEIKTRLIVRNFFIAHISLHNHCTVKYISSTNMLKCSIFS